MPIANVRRKELLDVLIEAQTESKRFVVSIAERDSIDYLGDRLLQKDEFEHHVLARAPKVLSVKQVKVLAQQYDYLSYQRAYLLHLQQREERADPTSEDKTLWYPAWGNQ